MKLVGNKDLSKIKQDAVLKVNSAYHDHIKQVPSSLQAVYAEKVKEANLVVNGSFNDSDIPFIKAEAVYRGITVEQVADSILVKNTEWKKQLADTEVLRLDVIGKIKTSTSVKEIEGLVRTSFTTE